MNPDVIAVFIFDIGDVRIRSVRLYNIRKTNHIMHFIKRKSNFHVRIVKMWHAKDLWFRQCGYCSKLFISKKT